MPLFSIGHSNVATEKFLALLAQHHIEILVDVRSAPYSRYNPQFNRETLQQSVAQSGREYFYLGDNIGGMPKDANLLTPEGHVDFARIESTANYQRGIAALEELGAEHNVAFMCAEADYHHCHRFHLITRSLLNRNIAVQHILHSGALIKSVINEFVPIQQSFSF